MKNLRLEQGLIVAALAMLVGGCSAWTGPRAAVEDRKVPGADRPKAAASKPAGAAKVSQAPTRKATEKPQREQRQAAKEAPGAPVLSADAISSDNQVLELKPEKQLR